MGEDLVLVQTDDRGVMTVTLNRPKKANAFNGVMCEAITAALEAAISDKDVRCLVIRGTGTCFSAGADLV